MLSFFLFVIKRRTKMKRSNKRRGINSTRRTRANRRKSIALTLLLIIVFTIGSAVFTDNADIEGQEIKSLGENHITAYCSCELCEGRNTDLTITYELRHADYTVAVDPNVVPLGSEILIEGKKYIASDAISGVNGKTIAIYKSWHDEVESFNTYNAEVFLVVK